MAVIPAMVSNDSCIAGGTTGAVGAASWTTVSDTCSSVGGAAGARYFVAVSGCTEVGLTVAGSASEEGTVMDWPKTGTASACSERGVVEGSESVSVEGCATEGIPRRPPPVVPEGDVDVADAGWSLDELDDWAGDAVIW